MMRFFAYYFLFIVSTAAAAPEGGSILGHSYTVMDDGSYLYKTKTPVKSRSASFRFLSLPIPHIEGSRNNMSYSSVYKDNTPLGIEVAYEWQVLRSLGSFGLQLMGGITVNNGNGVLSASNVAARETFSLYTLPLSLFLNYRFEYTSKQWVVPYLLGGATYFGLVEARNDGQNTVATSSPALGGGGGLHISLSRLDPVGETSLAHQYGVSDIWLTLEARAMKSLNSQVDYTGVNYSAGFSVDY